MVKFGYSNGGNERLDGHGVKVRIFSVCPKILGNSTPLNDTVFFEMYIIKYSAKPGK
jgi:hypothetical protein